ncbi:3-oxoacyl-[acyl-carrier protein] reductase [Paraburkholderia caribensis MBA4]|uniref:3-oxoacyl-[acyl-carrier protein] reductase n=1 Tax=Paraburkholderia caribensis MBA4 TaxID=1323664 RepID=A0A0P0RHQ6_9BURK|nr:SDR family oxidoreductase [Paraburkholderia caribensis]ALL68307.1 3-oxoacyl-[acyl-carrier protein] reductase [Paraburkholderia caribensis MBA4]
MNNRVAIVTGASRGIGRATAIRLAKDYGVVVLVARSADLLKDTAKEVRSASSEPLELDVDLRQPDAAKAVVEGTLAKFGRIDAVVNIAGAVPQVDVLEMTDEQWDDGFALKLHGARRLAILAWDALKAAGGSVIFTSGNSAQMPKSGFAAVATVNAAIVAMAKAFADRGVTDGVQVNSVLPGPVMTDRRRSYMEKYAPAHGMTVEEALEKFPAQAGITRYGKPEDIAELVAFVLSDSGRWLVGASLRMDGGEVKGL